MKSYFLGKKRRKGVEARSFFQMKAVVENGKMIIKILGLPDKLSEL